MHFEELWEQCEQLHKQEECDDISSVINELSLKVNLYRSVDQKIEIPEEERQKIKHRVMGEILLVLTHLSLLDNLNVFSALKDSLLYHSVDIFNQKYI